MPTDERILESVSEVVRLGKLVAPKIAHLAKAVYDDGIAAGLTPEQAWDLAMHALKTTSASV